MVRSFKLLLVVVLTVMMALSSAQNVFGVAYDEIAYDDGIVDQNSGEAAGGLWAVRFSLPLGCPSTQLLDARYFIGAAANTFQVRVMASDQLTDLTPAFSVTPPDLVNYWYDVDLTSKNILVTGDFYIVIVWLTGYQPNIGLDSTSGSGRTYYKGSLTPPWSSWGLKAMIRARVSPCTPVVRVSDLANLAELPTGNMTMIVGDLAINPHRYKPPGVNYQQGRDTTPLGYIRGMLDNPQPEMFDTNGVVVDANGNSGRPAGSWPWIFSIGGPGINAVSYYYESAWNAADRAPIKFGHNSTHFYWMFTSNGTIVPGSVVLQSSTNVPPGSSDVFIVQVFHDLDGRRVVLMYGTRYTGTWAAAWWFKFVVYPNIENYTNNYYIVRWTDAPSGTGSNFTPDYGDTYAVLAEGFVP